jgi:hypothetical protein
MTKDPRIQEIEARAKAATGEAIRQYLSSKSIPCTLDEVNKIVADLESKKTALETELHFYSGIAVFLASGSMMAL